MDINQALRHQKASLYQEGLGVQGHGLRTLEVDCQRLRRVHSRPIARARLRAARDDDARRLEEARPLSSRGQASRTYPRAAPSWSWI